MSLPHFGAHSGGKAFEHMQTVIQTSRRLNSFLHEAAQNFELYQKFKIKLKNNIKNLYKYGG
jgi:hypothetical protein